MTCASTVPKYPHIRRNAARVLVPPDKVATAVQVYHQKIVKESPIVFAPRHSRRVHEDLSSGASAQEDVAGLFVNRNSCACITQQEYGRRFFVFSWFLWTGSGAVLYFFLLLFKLVKFEKILPPELSNPRGDEDLCPVQFPTGGFQNDTAYRKSPYFEV